MAEGGNVSIKVLLDTAQFKQGVNQVKQDLNNLKSGNIDKIDASMDQASKSTDKLGQSVEKTAKQAQNLDKSVDKTAKSSEKLGTNAEKASKSTKKLGTETEKTDTTTKSLDSTLQKTNADFTKLDKSVKNTAQGVQGFGAKVPKAVEPIEKVPERASKNWKIFGQDMEGVGKTLQSVGSFATKAITVPMLAAGAASVAAAVNIDTSLTNVRKTVDGTEQDYQNLKQAAIEFSKTNAVSASQILDIQALGAQLGFSLSELQEFGEVVSGLEIATNMSADQAAEELAHFANITGMAHDEIRNYGSAIVDLGNNFATTESDISAMAIRIASAGSQAGMTQAEILGLATALSSVGIEAEAGGTAISQIMIKISNDVAKNSDNLQTWAETAGMSADQFAEAWRTSPVEALSSVLAGMNDATQESGKLNLILEELGITGIRQGDTLRRLAGAYDLTTDAVKTASRAWQEGTALQKEVDNRNESLAAKFEMLKNRLSAIGESIGGPLAEALLNVLNAAEPLFVAIERGAKAFNEMSKEQQGLALAAAGLAAAFGPALSITGKVVGSFQEMGKAGSVVSSGLDLMTSGFSKLIGAIGAGPFAAIAATLAVLGALMPAVISGFQEAATNAENLSDATESAGKATDAYKAAFDSAKGSAEGYAQSLDKVSLNMKDIIKRDADMKRSITESFANAGKDSGLVEYYEEVIDRLANSGRTLSEVEQGELSNAVSGLNDILGTNIQIVDGVTGALDTSTAAIHRYADAWQAAALAEVAANANKAIMEEKFNLTKELKAAEEERTQAVQRLKEAEEAGITGDRYTEIAQEAGAAGEKVDQLNGMIADCDAQMEENNKIAAEMQNQLAATAESLKQSAEGADVWKEALQTLGDRSTEFFDNLSETQISMEDFLGLSPEQIASIVSSYDGTVESITNALDGMSIVAAEKSQEAVDNFTEPIQSGQMEEAAHDAVEGVKNSWSGLSEGLVDEAGRIYDEFGNVVDVVQGSAADLGTAAEAVSDSAEGMADGWGNAKQETVDSAQSIKDALDNISDAAGGVLDNMRSAFNGLEGEFNSIGVSLGNSLSTGFASADMASSSQAVQTMLAAIQGFTGQFTATGTEQGQAFADGVQSVDGAAAGTALAQSADSGARSVDGSGAGANFGAGFVAGISSYVGAAAEAAAGLVRAAKAAADAEARSASPSREMIKRGKWFGQGWVIGIKEFFNKSYGAGRDLVMQSLNAIDTYTDYAAEDAGTKFIQAFMTGAEVSMTAGIESLAKLAREELGSFNLGSFIWGTVQKQAKSNGYTRIRTGNVYDSMRKIEAAGYNDLDDYIKAMERFDEEAKKWEKRKDKNKEDYEEWLQELHEFQDLQNSLTASLEQMQHWQPLYEVKKYLHDSLDDAEEWSDTLTTLVWKPGVVFSKNFVERVVEGGEDFQKALGLMKNASASEIQEMIDSFDDLARAEREAEINQRSLWVNSLYVLNHQGQNSMDWLLDFRETCLDVKEALYSDDSLYSAFQQLGVSVEEFAMGLTASGYTMEEFLDYLGDFTAGVADGFNGMSRDSQKGLEAWIHTLENNIVEAEHWAANLENVFSRAGGEGVDAFREAVLAGGFDKFGQIIAQLADASTEDINKAIETYWLALQTGERTGITSFMEMSGSEIASSAVEGIKEGTDIIADQIREMIGESAALGTKDAVKYREVGQAMAENLVTGITDSTTNAEIFDTTFNQLLDIGYAKAQMFNDVGYQMSLAVAQGILSGKPFIEEALNEVVILKDLAITYADEAVGAAVRAADAAAAAARSAASAAASFASAGGTAIAPQINWYATGGIFDKASIIGVGEAGPEAVVPLSGAAMQPFASAIAKQINNNGDSISNTITLNANVNSKATAETLARRIGVYTNREARKRGRRMA